MEELDKNMNTLEPKTDSDIEKIDNILKSYTVWIWQDLKTVRTKPVL